MTTMKRLHSNLFLVTDGSETYFEYKAPFHRMVAGKNEFKNFVEKMIGVQKLSDCQGTAKFKGVVLDDHRNHLKGYLIESICLSSKMVLVYAKAKDYTIPQALRRLWARQWITSLSEVHSRGVTVGILSSAISHRLDIVQHSNYYSLLPNTEGWRPPELRDIEILAPKRIEYSQKSDIFQLGLIIWRLSEQIPIGKKHFCVMFGCTTRPYHQCVDTQHASPVSLPFSQSSDPVLK